jgi:hypothetical protein
MLMAKTLKELFAQIQAQIGDVLGNEVAEMVKDVEYDTIQEEVYDKYHIGEDGQWTVPFEYERRGAEGGLRDRENMISNVSDDGTTLTVTNVTKGKTDPGLELAPLVEYGDDAGYGSYEGKRNRDETQDQYLSPRPFTQRTAEKIARENIHVKKLREGLKKRGLKVE